MYIFIYMCIHVYMYVYMYIYIYTHIHICIHIQLSLHMYTDFVLMVLLHPYWVLITEGCSGRRVQWIGVVLYSNIVYNTIQITTPCFHCTPPFAEGNTSITNISNIINITYITNITNIATTTTTTTNNNNNNNHNHNNDNHNNDSKQSPASGHRRRPGPRHPAGATAPSSPAAWYSIV